MFTGIRSQSECSLSTAGKPTFLIFNSEISLILNSFFAAFLLCKFIIASAQSNNKCKNCSYFLAHSMNARTFNKVQHNVLSRSFYNLLWASTQTQSNRFIDRCNISIKKKKTLHTFSFTHTWLSYGVYFAILYREKCYSWHLAMLKQFSRAYAISYLLLKEICIIFFSVCQSGFLMWWCMENNN